MKPCRLLLHIVAFLLIGWTAQVRAEKPSPSPKADENIALIYGPRYLTAHGWRMPYPPYPVLARQHLEQGHVYLHLETDRTGQVVRTSVLRTPLNTTSKTLRQLVVLWTLYKWSGPPNTRTNVHFEFRLHR